MPQFLSPEWLALPTEPADLAEGSICVAQRVVGTPWGEINYVTVMTPDGLRRTAGSNLEARIRLVTDYSTAVEVHEGTLSVPVALLSGRVKVSGDTSRLAEIARTLI